MNAHASKFVAALALLALASCAVGPVQDAALEDSRAYVYAVRSDPNVIAYAPAEIDQAVATLRRADDVAARGGSLTEIHDLAALARDRATLAQQSARMKAADVAAQAERQRLEVAARTREAATRGSSIGLGPTSVCVAGRAAAMCSSSGPSSSAGWLGS